MTTKITGDNISSIANTGVTWNAVTVADGSTTLNASAGNGYFLDTNAGVIEVFLPTSPSRGDTVVIADYAGHFALNNVIINTGTNNLDSTTTRQYKLTTNDQTAEFIYVDSAKGWITRILQAVGTTPSGVFTNGVYDTDAEYISATGGTVLTVGDYKTHVFTGDGCFVVSDAGNAQGSNTVDYLVVAGGGAGANGQGPDGAGGGGAGGLRLSNKWALPSPTTSPLASPTGITVTATTFPITVGGGGSAPSPGNDNDDGTKGSNSVFSTITSAGGGKGNFNTNPSPTAGPGGSGGGNHQRPSNSLGNQPPVSPPQGNPGAGSGPPFPPPGGGGGGAGSGAIQSDGTAGPPRGGTFNPSQGGDGGDGTFVDDTFFGPTAPSYGTPGATGSTRYFAGGGGGGPSPSRGGQSASEGGQGGGAGNPGSGPNPGTANTGGGGAGNEGYQSAGAGGKGIVVLRYKFQN